MVTSGMQVQISSVILKIYYIILILYLNKLKNCNMSGTKNKYSKQQQYNK
jgi:hypothetical protein